MPNDPSGNPLVPSETDDPEQERSALRTFLELYDRGEFYECHDVLEALWLEMGARRRSFYQGLLQASVSRLQAERGNLRAARILYQDSLAKLSPHRPTFMEVDLERFIDDLKANLPEIVTAPD